MRSVLALAAWLTLLFAAAGLGGIFLPDEWDAGLRKPSWYPPNWLIAGSCLRAEVLPQALLSIRKDALHIPPDE